MLRWMMIRHLNGLEIGYIKQLKQIKMKFNLFLHKERAEAVLNQKDLKSKLIKEDTKYGSNIVHLEIEFNGEFTLLAMLHAGIEAGYTEAIKAIKDIKQKA